MRSKKTFSLDQHLDRVGARVNAALDRLLPPETAEPPTIHKAMRYSIFAGGKRIRPVLCLTACEAVGGRKPPLPREATLLRISAGDSELTWGATPLSRGKAQAAMPLACAVECIHTYSLIHDDLPCMDDDDFRRGKPTSHKIFGEGIAVLAGDALLTHAFILIAKVSPPRPYSTAQLVRELALAAGSEHLIAGQVQDLENENRQATLDEVIATHKNKTGALITASIRLGAMAGGASASELKRLTRYGQDLGLAFQIIDDVLDATSTKEVMGKSVGADAKNQKSTFVTALGLEKSRAMAADLIADAHKQLKPFGKAAEPLRAIADFFLTRQK